MKTLVLFYSTYGHIWKMAEAIAEGAREVASNEVSSQARTRNATPGRAGQNWRDRRAAGFCARAGGYPRGAGRLRCHHLRHALPATATSAARCRRLWTAPAACGLLARWWAKWAARFVSTATQHGGQEETIRAFHTELLHHGFVIVGLPYAWQGQMGPRGSDRRHALRSQHRGRWQGRAPTQPQRARRSPLPGPPHCRNCQQAGEVAACKSNKRTSC